MPYNQTLLLAVKMAPKSETGTTFTATEMELLVAAFQSLQTDIKVSCRRPYLEMGVHVPNAANADYILGRLRFHCGANHLQEQRLCEDRLAEAQDQSVR